MNDFDVSYMGPIFRSARKEKGEKKPSLEKMLFLAHLLNIPGNALIHPQLASIDEEGQRFLRLFMQIKDRDKKIILAAIQEMLNQA